MRCTRAPALDCPTRELCGIMGCQHGVEADLAATKEKPLSDAPAPPAPRPPAGPAKQPPREIKVVAVPHGGWVFVEANAPIAVALDRAGAGNTLAQLLAG